MRLRDVAQVVIRLRDDDYLSFAYAMTSDPRRSASMRRLSSWP
jgi:hypothetical protein